MNFIRNSFKFAYLVGFTYSFIDEITEENKLPLSEILLSSHVIGSLTLIYPVTIPYYLYHLDIML